MSLAPKISVILAVYNAEKFIKQAIDSLLNQTFSDFEVIIVNDGSTDGSIEIIKSFKDVRILVIDQENKGLPASLNRAAEQAKGMYLARMDADDICLPDRFSRQVAFLEDNEEVMVVGSAVEYLDAQGRSVARSFPAIHTRFLMKQLIRGRCLLAHPTVMIRSNAFSQVGGYDESLGTLEDSVLWARMSRFGYTAANITTPLLKYRISDGAISSMLEDKEYQEIKRELFLNVDHIPFELVARFRKKHLELSQVINKRAAQRKRLVKTNIWNQIYIFFRWVGLEKHQCEKVVYKVRAMVDFWR
ncbi:glycosyltransferase [bacterium]|nr:glycosyltransferase [bacterium]